MHTNISCSIKKLNTYKGFGFLKVIQSDPYINVDVFFHVTSIEDVMNGKIQWDKMKVGLKVNAGIIEFSNRGYEAFHITIPVNTSIFKKRKNRNFKLKPKKDLTN